ncbi:uncharacterized protein SPSK_05734 [Sporothrix schenckii 1099-18]|uniref:Uncharacterized protein n=1 Tax=Sporothrix schenckii 1099-18 TaxID=1397361 RepID=A0A0F2LWK9_SPOSC|nr:uncharacterized protein SPSK_05734 [Sporothrix schenckii 1099-18]KJR80880.1 hypothetical protein SPSK_05734 [Sporothrix schenckii 1099-18]
MLESGLVGAGHWLKRIAPYHGATQDQQPPALHWHERVVSPGSFLAWTATLAKLQDLKKQFAHPFLGPVRSLAARIHGPAERNAANV